MAERAERRMSEDEFLAASDGQDGRWELVDGVVRMLVGVRRKHDRIAVNAVGLLRQQLRGRRCEPFTSETFVRIPGGNYRVPDAGVECGHPDPDVRWAAEPRLVIEILSPSTRTFDMFGKLDEYKSVASLTYILLIDPEIAQATLWTRQGSESWTHATVAGLDEAIGLPALDLTLPMAELYERVDVPSRPRLIT